MFPKTGGKAISALQPCAWMVSADSAELGQEKLETLLYLVSSAIPGLTDSSCISVSMKMEELS